MQTVAVIGIVALCAAGVIWRVLRQFGVGTGTGKPDCGCGHCHEKRREPR